MKRCYILSVLFFVVIIGLCRIAQADLNDGLIAYYPFNGNANDESGSGNAGTVIGARLTKDRFDNINSAYYFDGNGDYINVLDSSTLRTNQVSISVWVNPANATKWHQVITKRFDEYDSPWNSFIISTTSTDTYKKWIFGVSTDGKSEGGIIDPNFLSANQWTHIVGVYDGSNIKMYINNTLVGTKIKTGNILYSSLSMRIGAATAPTHSPDIAFKGSIDDVRVYNRALSESEIQELYDLEDSSIPEQIHTTTTYPATSITSTTATLSGNYELELIPADYSKMTAYFFEYGTTTNYGRIANITSSSFAYGFDFFSDIDNLLAATTYHYRLVVVDDSVYYYGNDKTFQTIALTSPLNVSISANQTSGYEPLEVSFYSSVDGGTPPYQFIWEFGDGAYGTAEDNSQPVTYTYSTSGIYQVALTVQDIMGQTVSSSITIVAEPVLNVEVINNINEGETATVEISWSDVKNAEKYDLFFAPSSNLELYSSIPMNSETNLTLEIPQNDHHDYAVAVLATNSYGQVFSNLAYLRTPLEKKLDVTAINQCEYTYKKNGNDYCAGCTPTSMAMMINYVSEQRGVGSINFEEMLSYLRNLFNSFTKDSGIATSTYSQDVLKSDFKLNLGTYTGKFIWGNISGSMSWQDWSYTIFNSINNDYPLEVSTIVDEGNHRYSGHSLLVVGYKMDNDNKIIGLYINDTWGDETYYYIPELTSDCYTWIVEDGTTTMCNLIKITSNSNDKVQFLSTSEYAIIIPESIYLTHN
ncbi:MAG: C39 family peptidase [Desulfamplus sp.]|nr:C39 family peptidase [Desulfamplus sp.]